MTKPWFFGEVSQKIKNKTKNKNKGKKKKNWGGDGRPPPLARSRGGQTTLKDLWGQFGHS
jgi:hypothetical protein